MYWVVFRLITVFEVFILFLLHTPQTPAKTLRFRIFWGLTNDHSIIAFFFLSFLDVGGGECMYV